MTPTRCPRLFEVEAAIDGRVTGAELASFERHMTMCPECLREAEALDALDQAVRDVPAGKGDEFRMRRERTRLLTAFDRELVTPGRRWDEGRLLWVAPVAALVVGLLIFWHMRPAQPQRVSSAVVRAESATVWSERKEDNLDQILLERGSLWIHVDHSSARSTRVVVVLPDGELEDTGTTFMVSAENGRTTRVAVQDGSVVLRVHGQLGVTIGPGQTWSPDLRPVASACASSAPSTEPIPSGRGSALARTVPAPSSRGPLALAIEPDPSVDFFAAMSALDVGDNVGAAAAFATFLVKHPRDPRAEDAAYLRVMALQRSGDDGSTKQAAKEYLQRYPTGFRHKEAEILSR